MLGIIYVSHLFLTRVSKYQYLLLLPEKVIKNLDLPEVFLGLEAERTVSLYRYSELTADSICAANFIV